ncbi:hypothetical protein, putative DNA-binding domain [Hyphomicrobium sp. GJ21]|uniref:helix-turn-helix transcriptional regulator n=1 Tax=Hyphomicrobium sp. GJ21 TaxID=113574 RepID=UPI000622BDE1|nr:helix-turn-helix transcriptional regulator [Hyphomicrobium sp. GJ21]CEJ88075.1 hypothetical protein, putative DNA-binding domain [Hyphomicrobium sp. GJ21]
MLIESVIQALAEPDLREGWADYLASAISNCHFLGAVSVRFVVNHSPAVSFIIGSGPKRAELERFLSHHPTSPPGTTARRAMTWTIPIVGLELADCPAGLYATGETSSEVSEALGQWSAKEPLDKALLHTQKILEARVRQVKKSTQAERKDAVVLVDRRGQILHHNEKAAVLMNALPELIYESPEKQLMFRSKRDNSIFRAALRNFFHSPNDGGKTREILGRELICQFSEADVEWPPKQIAAVTLRRMKQEIDIGEAELMTVLRATEGQAKLAKYLLDGKGLKEFSRDQGISHAGARYHLGPLMRRLDCHSQAELVRRLYLLFG